MFIQHNYCMSLNKAEDNDWINYKSVIGFICPLKLARKSKHRQGYPVVFIKLPMTLLTSWIQ